MHSYILKNLEMLSKNVFRRLNTGQAILILASPLRHAAPPIYRWSYRHYVNAHGTNTPRPGLGSGEGETLPTDTSCAAV